MYSISIAAVSAIGFAKTVLVALTLSPADFGIYAALLGIALSGSLVVPGIAMLPTASGMRATDSAKLLLLFTVVRTATALFVVVPMAFFLGWERALAGEFAVQGLVAAWGWRTFARNCKAGHPSLDKRFTEAPAAVAEGRTLYASNLAGSVVPFGGRGIIALLADAATAGYYALAMTFVQIAQMFTPAVAQREGPEITKRAYRGEVAIARQLAIP